MMSEAQQRALARYRNHRQPAGVVRLEVHVWREDVELVCGVVRALADPTGEAETRAWLREGVGVASVDLKRLFAGGSTRSVRGGIAAQ